MLRVAGLTLWFLVSIAAPAEAKDIANAVESGPVAAQPSTSNGETSAIMQGRPATGRLSLPAAATQSPLRSGPSAGLGRGVVRQAMGPVGLRAQRRERRNSIALPWLSHGRSGVAVPLTERLYLGLGYRHVQGEDRWREFAETGSVDYDSHFVLVQAHWRF